jgi:membrane-associated phospholipid phosphatase
MSCTLRTILATATLAVFTGGPVLAQTVGEAAPITAAAEAEASSLEQSPGPFSTATPFKAPNFFQSTLTDFRTLSSSRDTVTWLAIGALVSTATRSIDRTVTNEFAGAASLQPVRAGNTIGGKEFQFGVSATAFAIGRLTGNERLSDVSGKVMRAQILALAVTGAIKKTAQRERPDRSDTRSFPSGHTSVSFASATVLQRELGWKVGIPSYAVASYVAAARIEKKKHFLSDVAFGAAIGILAGRTVTIGSGEKRFAVSPVATPGGAAVSFSLVQ